MKTLWGIVCIFVLAYYFTHGEEDRGDKRKDQG